MIKKLPTLKTHQLVNGWWIEKGTEHMVGKQYRLIETLGLILDNATSGMVLIPTQMGKDIVFELSRLEDIELKREKEKKKNHASKENV